MTKFSQCNTCQIGKGIHCDHYKPVDDSDCEAYISNEIKVVNEKGEITSRIIKQPIHGWLLFFLGANVIGTLYSSIQLFSELSPADNNIVSIIFCLFIAGMGILDLSFTGYLLYSFFTYKPNAVFIGKAYIMIAFLTNVLSMLLSSTDTNGEAFHILKQLIGGIIWFSFLCLSKQVNDIFPVENRQILKRDWILIGVYLAYPILFMLLIVLLKE